MLQLWHTKVQIGGDDYIGLLNNSITGSVIQIAPTAARLRESIRTKAYRVVAKYNHMSNSKRKTYGGNMTTFDVYHGEVINPTQL